MGMHRWLLGPLICLILATTSARPPECEEAPYWSINGQQPLAETKGKASMLEALLNHFRSYGMDDLEFIIVNSKLSHSQDKLHELHKRVSFAVYQETDEEEVWSVMEGGKDDMYVYDRCGRLTFFIPFPLSILNESPLVSNAILATYFRSPCGDSCDQNKSLEIEEFVKNLEKDFEVSNNTEQESVVYEVTDQPIAGNETSNETSISNDLFALIDSGNDFAVSNFSDSNNVTDYDYGTSNDISHLNETNSTAVDKAKTIFNSIYMLFLNSGKNNETFEDTYSNSTLNNVISNGTNAQAETSNVTNVPTDNNNETNAQIEISNDLHRHAHYFHHKHGHKEKNDQRDKKKSDRCLEADYEVCKSWSKKRLLNAQRCCSGMHTDADLQQHRTCGHFRKKRCKKIQSILKCCIKTVYTEPTTTTTTEEQTETTEASNGVCCKTTDEGRLCRVLTTRDCEEDEERSPSQTK